MFTEREIQAPNGILFILVLLVLQVAAFATLIKVVPLGPKLVIPCALITIAIFICWFGFFMVNPKEGRVL